MLKRLLFGEKKDSTAQVAKDRLQIIIAHQRGDGKPPVDMEALEADLLEAIKRHIDIDDDGFDISLDEGELDISIDLSKMKEKSQETKSESKKTSNASSASTNKEQNSRTKPKHLNRNKKKR